MKKLTALLMALCMVFALTACGSTTEDASDTADDTSAAETEDSTEETEDADTAETEEADAESEADAEEEGDAEEAEDTSSEAEVTLNVFIAASLNNAFEELKANYEAEHPNVTITLNAASSGTLLTQIQEGYDCDIFFSASTKEIDQLEEEGRIVDGTRTDLLKNEVVVITWQGSGTTVTGLDNLSEAASIALADGSVPVGRYTRTALQASGVLDSSLTASDITTAEVSEALGGVEINECANVSAVLQAVAEGSNEVGTVYYSDAYSEIDRIEILEHVSTDLTGNIIYPVAQITPLDESAVSEEQTAAAEEFLAYITSDEAMEVFTTYMFLDNR
ncbi:MAG: molybdate ABC transporter substrate-binding protein [Clostridiales bacterium]|nr:molybdate ABC transporter substrate-binding protein [Clostridiales bacterium]